MHYWNRDNFEGLRAIAERYGAKPGYEAFARYCLLRERGLRKQAMEAVRAFIDAARQRPVNEQRGMADELASLQFRNGAVHQLIPDPLFRYLTGVLRTWADADGVDPVPHRWLGYMTGDRGCLEKALERAPADQVSLALLAAAYLGDLDYRTHHLVEAKLIGDVDQALELISLASSYIARLDEGAKKDGFNSELDYFRRLMAAWREYISVAREVSFPAWCESKGWTFDFLTIVYYEG